MNQIDRNKVKDKKKQASIKSNFLYNLIYQAFTIITPIITTPYISRVLSADGIGKYSYALSVATYFGIFGTLGITTYGQLEIAKRRDNENELHYIIKDVIMARIITMLISTSAYSVLVFKSTEYREMYMILLFYMLAQMNDVSYVFQGLEWFKKLAVRNFVIKLISILLIFICVHDRKDLYLYIFIIQGTIFIGNFCLWPYIWEYIKPSKKYRPILRTHWKNSMIYFIPTVATTVYTVLDKSMIGWITGSEFQNGYYEQAHKIVQILIAIITALGTVTLPRMVYLFENKKRADMRRIMDMTMKAILFMSIPMTFGLIAVADNLVPCFLGNGYEESIGLVKIFSFLIIIIGLDNTIGKQCLISTGKQKVFNNGVIIGAMLNLCMNLILIPRLGATGAAISSVCAELLILCIFIYNSKEYLYIKQLISSIITYTLLSFLMATVVWIIGLKLEQSILTLIFQMIVGISIYLCGGLFLKDAFLISIIRSILNTRKI